MEQATNNPMKTRHLYLVLIIIVLVQTAHFAEHVAQLIQIYGQGIKPPEAHGLLGSVFDFEWVHFLYNIGLEVTLIGLWLGYRRAGQTHAVSVSRMDIRLLGSLALFQGYHSVEHIVKLYQYLFIPLYQSELRPTPGILPQVTGWPIFLVHFGFNLIVWAAMAVALWRLRPPGLRATTAALERRYPRAKTRLVSLMVVLSILATVAPQTQTREALSSVPAVDFDQFAVAAAAAVPSCSRVFLPLVMRNSTGGGGGTGGPDFVLRLNPECVEVSRGGNVTTQVNVVALNGFNGTVNLTLEGAPSGVTGAFSASSINTSGSSNLSLSVGSGVLPGTYILSVKGTSGSLVRTATLMLIVLPAVTIVRTSPANGEGEVAVTRETIVEFGKPINLTGIITDTFSAQFGGQTLAARRHLSPDRLRVTLFYSPTLPASARVRVTVIGDNMADDQGARIDADGDGVPGGVGIIDFDTLSLSRIPGTDVWGYVFDSYNKNPNGSDRPVVGATIRVDGFPEANAVTDQNGYFILRDMPAPMFFVHIDGSTATNAPPGTVYATVGKPFHSVAGRSTQLTMDGETFNIYLPPMSLGDVQNLSPTQETDIGFGPAGKAKLVEMFPTIDPAVWDQTQVMFPPNSAVDDMGNPATQAAIIPVPSDRLPAPLPPNVGHQLDIAVMAMGATNFDTPAPACFPNLPDQVTGQPLPAGAKSALWSFNHDTGQWEVVGPMTVTADGKMVCTDPGVGIRAPGWHGTMPGVPASGGPPLKTPPPLEWEDIARILQERYNARRGTAAAALAHQIACIARISCDNQNTWGGGFIKEVFRYIASHPLPDPPLCRRLPPWLPVPVPGSPPGPAPSAGDVCALLGGIDHFQLQLWPAFLQNCPINDAQHDSFLDNAVVPCFDEVFLAGELTSVGKTFAQQLVPLQARQMRRIINAQCGTLQAQRVERLPLGQNPLPTLPPPLTKDDLYSPALAAISTLKVEVGDRFFLSAGTTAQLRVTKAITGGGEIDLTPSATGTTYFAFVAGEVIPVTLDGLMTIPSTPSPVTSYTPMLYVLVHNGDDIGIGQFAVTDVDSDGDLIVDSYERSIGLNPAVQNGLDSDLDDDGLNDVYEALAGINPRVADTDGDTIDDETEIRVRLNPRESSLAIVIPQSGRYPFAIENLSNGLVLRGVSSSGGTLDGLTLAPNTRYRVWFLQPGTGWVGRARFVTPNSGLSLNLPGVILEPPSSSDTDGDGLSSDAEFIVGTNPANADTDGDGVNDGAEVQQGTNPLDGLPAATGIIASADTPGTAVDIAAFNDIAVVADSDRGVSVLSVVNGTSPVIIAQVDTPGTAQAVAFFSNLVAVADGTAGLAIIDVTDPPAARIIHQINLGGTAQAVTTAGRVAYVGLTTGQVVAVDMTTGTELGRVTVGSAVVDVALGGDHLYVLTSGTLHAVSLDDLTVVGSATSPGFARVRRQRLFVGGGIAYAVQDQGYNTFSLANPAQPVLIASGITGQTGWKQIVANGSGLGVAVVGVTPFDQTQDIYLYDVSNPAVTNQFLTLFPTPGRAEAVSIYNGLAYVADGQAGLQVINYLAYDALGRPPTITLSTNFGTGLAEEGKTIRATAIVSDDVQVRNVEFYVDGVKAATDGNFPFEHRFTTPLRSQQPSFTLRAKATDTGGNLAWTDAMTLTLVADATPPQVRRVSPRDNSKSPTGSVSGISATFSEPISSTMITTATFRLFSAGPDGFPGTADDVLVTGGTLSYRDETNTALLTFGTPLPDGLYRAVVSPAITDLAGRPLVGEFAWIFGVAPPVFWVRDADGFWDDPTNWSTGAVPGPDDTVIISRPAGEFTITHRFGNTSIVSLRSSEAIVLSGGSLSISATAQISNAFTFSGGTLSGSGDVMLNGPSTWTGGTMSGPGAVNIGVSGTLNLNGVSAKTLNGGVLNNLGNVIWTGTGNINTGNGAVVNNLAGGVFDAQNDASFWYNIGGAAPTFNNAGIVRKSAGSGTTTFLNVAFSGGNVEVLTGTLSLAGNNTTTTGGVFTVTAGAVLDLTGGQTRIYTGSYTGAGAGTVRLQNGTLQVGAAGATFNFPGNLVQWTGGVLTGPGVLTNTGTLNLSGATAKQLSGNTLNNAGNVTWSGTGNINTGNGAVVNNLASGLFDAQNDASFWYNIGGAAPTFNNAGVVRKSAGSGTTSFLGVAFSGGSVEVLTGTLSLAASGTTTTGGNFSVASGAVLDLTGGQTRTYVGNYTGSGAGTIRLGSGTLQVGAGGATFNFSGNVFQWTGGTLTGPGVLTNTGTLNLSGVSAKTLNGGVLNNLGNVIWTGTGNINTGNGAVVNNLAGGVFDAQNDASFWYNIGGAAPTFNNAGIVRKSAGSGTTTFLNVAFSGGNVEVLTGTLSLAGNNTTTTGGVFTVTAGAVLDLTGGQTRIYTGNYTGTGAGTVWLNSGTLQVGAGGATFNFPGSLFQWTGGSLKGPAILTNTGTLVISGTIAKSLDGLTLNNAGNVAWTGTGPIYLYNGAVVNNLASGLFNAQDNATLTWNGGAAGTFNNAGLFRKSAGTGTTTFGSNVAVTNTNTVQAQSGALNFTTGYTQITGTTSLSGGNISGSTLNIQGGGLSGAGTITATVAITGQVNPGGIGSPGVLNIVGNYRQAAAGVLNIELGGLTVGTQYDRLSVTGSATLDGTLDVSLISGFVPSAGDSFQIMSYGSRTNVFATINGHGRTYTPNYNPTNLTIVAQ